MFESVETEDYYIEINIYDNIFIFVELNTLYSLTKCSFRQNYRDKNDADSLNLFINLMDIL